MKSIHHSSPDISESENSVQIRHDRSTCKSFLFHTVLMLSTIALVTANPIYFCFRFTTINAYYIILHIRLISESTAAREHSPPLLTSFALSLVSKILPVITFCKPNFLFAVFLPLFILSFSEWPRFSFKSSINFSLKEIFIDSAECLVKVSLGKNKGLV